MLLVYEAKNATAVVSDVTNIETAACLKVSAIKFCKVSVCSISVALVRVFVVVVDVFENLSSKTHCQIFTNIKASSAPIP